MPLLIWGGTAIVLIGLAGLIWTIIQVARARSEDLDDEALRQRLQKLVPVNLGALFVAAFGLIVVIIGLVLG